MEVKKTTLEMLSEYYTKKAYAEDIKNWQTAQQQGKPPNTESDRPTQKRNKQSKKTRTLRKKKRL